MKYKHVKQGVDTLDAKGNLITVPVLPAAADLAYSATKKWDGQQMVSVSRQELCTWGSTPKWLATPVPPDLILPHDQTAFLNAREKHKVEFRVDVDELTRRDPRNRIDPKPREAQKQTRAKIDTEAQLNEMIVQCAKLTAAGSQMRTAVMQGHHGLLPDTRDDFGAFGAKYRTWPTLVAAPVFEEMTEMPPRLRELSTGLRHASRCLIAGDLWNAFALACQLERQIIALNKCIERCNGGAPTYAPPPFLM
uniref:Uncharacterized protein n=1 Tax=Prymnesium polylepis TaxID=72548 RepID=A0A7S4ICM8_9EUKA|mmetsp:Transcript_29712/g.72989  ORF Transcript_29712/g.72989 Transcript_29712/m.72989 type:complete len:250 (+) Transcript_29712:168-917(+)